MLITASEASSQRADPPSSSVLLRRLGPPERHAGVMRPAFRLFFLLMEAAFACCLWAAVQEGIIWHTPLLTILLEMLAAAVVPGQIFVASIPEVLSRRIIRFIAMRMG